MYWIEVTYHRRRRKAALGKLTPVEFEEIKVQSASMAQAKKENLPTKLGKGPSVQVLDQFTRIYVENRTNSSLSGVKEILTA